MNSFMRIKTLLFASCFLLFAAGCGGGGGEGGDQLTGRVQIDGSSTVYPVTQAVAEEFMQEHPRARVQVSMSGTGGGFSKFLRGETDINNASRPITAEELQKAQQNDANFIELPVAYDGIAVVANPQNDWLNCLTVEELRSIWAPNSDVQTWSDVRPSFPDQQISLYGPGTASGTYDYFTEAVVGEEGASRTDFTASEDDNVLVQGVAGDEGALGFFGLAYYEENQDQLKLIGIDDGNPNNGEGCVKPSAETVANNTYQPLSRPLLMYVSAAHAGDEAVNTFVNYYLNNVGQLARQVGYVPLSSEAYELAQQRFENRTTGTLFGKGEQQGMSVEQLLRQSQGGAPADTAAATDTTAS